MSDVNLFRFPDDSVLTPDHSLTQDQPICQAIEFRDQKGHCTLLFHMTYTALDLLEILSSYP